MIASHTMWKQASSDGEQCACMRLVAHVKRRKRVVTGPSKGSAAKGRPDLRLHGTKSYAQVALRRKTGRKDLRLSPLRNMTKHVEQ
jgi:hypothetical protein